jgi:hypothetical protein
MFLRELIVSFDTTPTALKTTRLANTVLLPLWSSGQSSRLHIKGSRVRFPALPDFPTSSRPGMESTQPREKTEELKVSSVAFSPKANYAD